MPKHAEARFLPYSREQMFDLVADIERYPEFVPWCVGARVRHQRGEVITADMMIGFRMLREMFTSRVTLCRPERIDVEYENGPFRYLKNQWVFLPREGGCVIDFYIDFEVRSRVLRTVLEPLFSEAVGRMISSFESRARAIYGVPDASPSASRA